MINNVGTQIDMAQIVEYLKSLPQNPLKIVTLIIDLGIVIFLIVKLVKLIQGTRALQLLKGIIFLILITIISGLLQLNILNYILTSFMTYGGAGHQGESNLMPRGWAKRAAIGKNAKISIASIRPA